MKEKALSSIEFRMSQKCSHQIVIIAKLATTTHSAFTGETHVSDFDRHFNLNDFISSHGATASSCGKILKQGLDDNLKQEILDAHNDLRGKVARGEEPELRGVTASNMMELRSHPQDY